MFKNNQLIIASFKDRTAQSARVVEYTNCISAKAVKDAILDMTLNTDTDGEAPLILELWGMWSTPSVPSLPGPVWPEVIATDRVLSMGQLCVKKIFTYTKLN